MTTPKFILLYVIILLANFTYKINTATNNLALFAVTDPSTTVPEPISPNCCSSSFAVDGNPQTQWSSFPINYQNIIFDLGKTINLDIIEIVWGEYYASEYAISISRDLEYWDLLYHELESDGDVDVITQSAADVRYIFLDGITSPPGLEGLSIKEFSIYQGECSPHLLCLDGCCDSQGQCISDCSSSTGECEGYGECISGQCYSTPKDCDDGNPQTFDTCNEDSGECSSVEIPCLGEAVIGFTAQPFLGWENYGSGFYNSDVRNDEEELNITGPNDPTGTPHSLRPTMGCALFGGQIIFSIRYETADVDYLRDYPFYRSFNGEETIINPNVQTQFDINVEYGWFCFGIQSIDGIGGAAKLTVYDFSAPVVFIADCSDTNACTNDGCNIETGYCSAPSKDCSDNDLCTDDYCSFQNGECFSIALDCDDGEICTNDYCEDGECFHDKIICNDFNECTLDVCDLGSGCTFTSLCDDNDLCTTDSCNPVVGCIHTEVVCVDDNTCTRDYCNSKTGCVFEVDACDDHNPCTIDKCESGKGCVHSELDCSDGLKCTEDRCDPLLPEGSQCVNRQMICISTEICKVSQCDEMTLGCVETARDCDDGLYCTIDSCVSPSGCIHIQRNCDDNNPCTIDLCNNEQHACEHLSKACNDDNLCTSDSCSPTGCIFSSINCDDGDVCTFDRCSPQKGCVHSKIDCDDGNACTTDSCDSIIGCKHVNLCSSSGCVSPADCDFGNVSGCDTTACVSGNCILKSANCDDGNVCTSDECVSGRCFHLNLCS